MTVYSIHFEPDQGHLWKLVQCALRQSTFSVEDVNPDRIQIECTFSLQCGQALIKRTDQLSYRPSIFSFFFSSSTSPLSLFLFSAPFLLSVQRLGELFRKLWNPRHFRAHVSPHEMLQAVSSVSKKRFKITEQGVIFEKAWRKTKLLFFLFCFSCSSSHISSSISSSPSPYILLTPSFSSSSLLLPSPHFLLTSSSNSSFTTTITIVIPLPHGQVTQWNSFLGC